MRNEGVPMFFVELRTSKTAMTKFAASFHGVDTVASATTLVRALQVLAVASVLGYHH